MLPIVHELSAEQLRFTPPAGSFDSATIDELPQAEEWFGQERALAALELGLRIRHRGYNIYVCGLYGTNRERDLAQLLERFTAAQPIPGDRVLVQNFRDRERPRAISLAAGQGIRLQREMRELIEDLRRSLPATFRAERLEQEKEKIGEVFTAQSEALQKRLAEHAAQAGFALHPTGDGELTFIPIKDGRPIEPQDLAALDPQQQQDLKNRQRALSREVKAALREQRRLMGRVSREVNDAERRAASEYILPLFEELAQRYPQAGLRNYFDEVRDHILDHRSDFEEKMPQPSFPFAGMAESEAESDYEINVLVDNSASKGAPVIVESSPTYKKLFGAVERMVDRFGKLVTNFTRITAGSLLRAHGGVIVINVVDALSEPLVWRALKRCLKTGQVEIEAYDPFALFVTSALKPEPMAIDVRVVLTGPSDLFQLLYSHDDEFRCLFKVRAEFGFEVDCLHGQHAFAAQVARIVKSEGLAPVGGDAMARLMEFAARSVGDRRKLPTQWEELGDILSEAAYFASKSQSEQITAVHVEEAVAQRSFRLDQYETRLRELIRDRILMIDLEGERVGQVNGLAVLEVGGYGFGRPARITASVSMGSQGVIAVDREAELSGKTYDKGVLILSGYLRQLYAQDFPLSLCASLAFEQSYSGVDGDSASAAEVFALLSSLSAVPLRQDLAVTGSVNQFGAIQPIGDVNEKVEGFFQTCRAVGLTGKQGVLIPAQNVDHLIPHRSVTEAVAAGTFHIYPIRTVDEGIEILTGRRAGTIEQPGTIHHLVSRRLRRWAEGLERFRDVSGRPALNSGRAQRPLIHADANQPGATEPPQFASDGDSPDSESTDRQD